jgi:hypothetical protein
MCGEVNCLKADSSAEDDPPGLHRKQGAGLTRTIL